MTENRREQERYSLHLQAKISYRHTKDAATVYDTVAANISAGGAFLTTSHDFPIASKVKIEFYLNVDDLKRLKFIISLDTLKKLTSKYTWVVARGIVIRKEGKGVAVIFDTNYQLTPMQSPDESI